MAPLRIEVTGESTIYRPAERAVVSITVSSEGPSQEEVSRNVTSTSSKLRETLESMSVKDASGQVPVVSRWSNSTLSTGSYFNHSNEGMKSRIYNALTTFQVRFQDFSRLGSFASSLSFMEHVSIDNIEWRLTDKTKESLSSQSRYQAVQDAVKKGEDFAAALGASGLPVVSIKDDGNYSSHTFATRNVQAAALFGAEINRSGGGTELSFEPENVALQCTITVVLERKT